MTAEGERVKDTPSALWREKNEPDPHGERYNVRRVDLLLGNLTDDEMANAVFMEWRGEISVAQAGKDRIRWLSRQLFEAASERDRMKRALVPIYGKVLLIMHEPEDAKQTAEIAKELRDEISKIMGEK